MIGIDPNDPYGRIMADIFVRNGPDCDVKIKARFGTTVCALVANGLGIAIIDEFTVGDGHWAGIKLLKISKPTSFQTYVACRRDARLSSNCEYFITSPRRTMRSPAKRAAGKLTRSLHIAPSW